MRINLNTDALKTIFTKLPKFCDDKRSARPILRCVHLEFENNIVTAIALNGYILCQYKTHCGIIEGEGKITLNVLPDKLMKFTSPIVELNDEIDGFLQISAFGAKQLFPIIDEPYIEWEKVIPTERDWSIDLSIDAPRYIAFDPSYLKPLVEIAGKETIRMKFGRPTDAAWCAIGDDLRVLILPVRLNQDAFNY